ncbi:MAG: hypothetical protein JNJ49_13140 [Bdellovibrionaceae bacterium]|nr:hypothetical protein [Pseudobdellovibrionaceae bacterium]
MKSRKLEKVPMSESKVVIQTSDITTAASPAQDRVSQKKTKGARRSSAGTVDFEEPESTWMNWSANRVTAAPASVAMATLQHLCALEDQLLGWAESQITTRLHSQK